MKEEGNVSATPYHITCYNVQDLSQSSLFLPPYSSPGNDQPSSPSKPTCPSNFWAFAYIASSALNVWLFLKSKFNASSMHTPHCSLWKDPVFSSLFSIEPCTDWPQFYPVQLSVTPWDSPEQKLVLLISVLTYQGPDVMNKWGNKWMSILLSPLPSSPSSHSFFMTSSSKDFMGSNRFGFTKW